MAFLGRIGVLQYHDKQSFCLTNVWARIEECKIALNHQILPNRLILYLSPNENVDGSSHFLFGQIFILQSQVCSTTILNPM